MSDIMVKISSIAGESEFTDYVGQIECTAAKHVVQLPVVSTGSQRTEGASQHGAYELSHAIDKASPGLRLAASAGTNLNEVVITTLHSSGGKYTPMETVTLQNAYVVELGLETPLDPETREPDEEPVETFSLEYSAIKWEYHEVQDGTAKGTVAGEFDVSTQTAA